MAFGLGCGLYHEDSRILVLHNGLKYKPSVIKWRLRVGGLEHSDPGNPESHDLDQNLGELQVTRCWQLEAGRSYSSAKPTLLCSKELLCVPEKGLKGLGPQYW